MKTLVIASLLLLQACGLDKAITAASEAEKQHEIIQEAKDNETSVKDALEESDSDKSDSEKTAEVVISRPDQSNDYSFAGSCSDFAIEGDFKAAIDPKQGAVLSVKMNDDCDNARFRFVDGELTVDMCSNGIEWSLADKKIKHKVTKLQIVRERGEMRFEYHANGKDEVLEFISVSGPLEDAVNVCIERL